jgi:hypothetical protein
VSWLHHCAFSRGEAELARSIADAAGDTLPWRTTWTNRRPFGHFGRYRRKPIGEPSDDPTRAKGGADSRARGTVAPGPQLAKHTHGHGWLATTHPDAPSTRFKGALPI